MSLLRDRINRNRNNVDIGLDHGAQAGRQRTVNLDGSYNIKKITGERIDFDLYHWLITTSWNKYWLTVFLFYGFVNFIFAVFFYLAGPQNIAGISPTDNINDFMQCFFFSNQTFTTVGYGGMHPTGLFSSWLASMEAFIGLMSFALATGTLYGRFSKPKPNLKFSRNMIIAPVGEVTGLQFQLANQRASNIMDLEATVNFSWVDNTEGDQLRRFKQLNLELSKIAMFPLSWTINHIIDEQSPLYGMTEEEMKRDEIEIFVSLRGFDETYAQTIYIRMSYTWKDLIYGAKFQKPFYVGPDGKVVMDLRKVGSYDLAELPKKTIEIGGGHAPFEIEGEMLDL
ncbi:MAG: Ion transport 2 domain protein [Bacteroidetes bacterium]|nr:Ion transport 2 domain protein [Bacteroidota bacterium]